MRQEYSDSHTAPGKGASYDDDFRSSAFLSYLWHREREILRALLGEEVRSKGSGLRYLDFACGTGRILAALEDLAPESIGLDISHEMLSQARKKVNSSILVQGDFLKSSEVVEGTFDFATAFRFFPNADPALRRDAARFLADKVGEGGLLVVNNHQNSSSLLSLLGRVVGREWPWEPMRNHVLVELLEQAGFRLVGCRSLGLLPGTARRAYAPEWVHATADLAGRLPAIRWLGQDVMLWFRR